MNCIRCRAPMKSIVEAEAKVSVENCICCRGSWFKQKDFLSAAAIPNIGSTGAQFKQDFNCPQCERLPMYIYRMEGSTQTILSCQKCFGVWVDGGTFLKLKQTLQEIIKKAKAGPAKDNLMATHLPKNITSRSSDNNLIYIIVGVIALVCIAFLAYRHMQ